MRKTPQPKRSGHLQQFSATRTFETVGVDILPLPRTTHNLYIVVIVDRFSRWVELAPVPDIIAPTIARAIVTHIVLRHWCPQFLLTDRGSQFRSAVVKQLCKRLRIDKIFTSAKHPQTNGQVERFNRVITAALTSYVNNHQNDWDEYIDAIAFAYRTCIVDAVQNTPFYLVYGRDPILPTDVLQCTTRDLQIDVQKYGILLTERLREAHAVARNRQAETDRVRKRAYDATHREVEFELGSLVLVHQTARRPGVNPKLSKHYDGSYRVLEKMSPVTYKLQHVYKTPKIIVHVQRIIPYYERQVIPYYERQETGENEAENESEDDDSVSDEDASVTGATPTRMEQSLAMPEEHVKASDMYIPFRAHGGRRVEIVDPLAIREVDE